MKYLMNWSAGLMPEQQKNFEELLGVNNKVLDRLCDMCYNMINELEVKSSNFETPDWALRQAFLVGQRTSLERIIQLCTPVQERDPAPQ